MNIRHISYILMAALLLAVLPSSAQRKEIDQARSAIKTGKESDLAKAEKLLTALFSADETHRQNLKIYVAWFDVVTRQYELANEKLYLHQKYDTVAFFNLTRHLYDIAVTTDSIDASPDKKGKVRPRYRREHSQLLNLLRPNLYYGGTYHIRKGNYGEAYEFFDHYLGAASNPLFEAYHYETTDSIMPQAAYWAVFCGHRLQDAERTLRYSQQALRDLPKRQFVLQYLCDAFQWQQQQEAYVETLREGFEAYPEYPYFFPRLADYYTAKGQTDSVMVIANRGIEINPQNTLFLLAKSIALLNTERYDECIAVSQQMLQINDTLPEPYYHIATCYLNQALALEQLNEPRRFRSQLQKLYANARPYMEDYRRLMPADRQRWAPALYRIYLNLNMGRQFEEIDRLMKQ